MKVTVLAGGVGAARFLEGVLQVVAPEDVTVVSNTGDDDEFFGLHVSPDIDTVIYTLARAIDPVQGWGLAGETYHALDALGRFGYETWFSLGDADLATHVVRTRMLREGATLSEATARVAAAFGLRLHILPMSDDPIRTIVETDEGDLRFQEYFVKRRTEINVGSVRFQGAEQASAAPGVLDAIAAADAVLLAPSNPVVSIGPMLAVPGIRDALRAVRAKVAAISPIIGGRTVKGPADRMMASLGMAPTAAGVAEAYRDIVHALVIDDEDAALAPAIEAAGVRCVVTQTIMRGPAEKRALAAATLAAVQ